MATPSLRRLSSRQNPIIGRFRALARHRGTPSEVLIEGGTLIVDAAAAGWAFDAVAVTERAMEDTALAAAIARLPLDVDRLLVTGSVMNALSPVPAPSGAIAIALAPERSLEDVLGRPGLLVCAVDVQDPGNLGAIVRVAEAAGATGVMACGASADPFGWKAVRGAMGSAFRVPIVRRLGAAEALVRTRDAGWHRVASVLLGDPPERIDFSQPTALFLGSEGSGLPADVIAACEEHVAVPMDPPVESLNVAVAAAVILYEARRQRSARSPS